MSDFSQCFFTDEQRNIGFLLENQVVKAKFQQEFKNFKLEEHFFKRTKIIKKIAQDIISNNK